MQALVREKWKSSRGKIDYAILRVTDAGDAVGDNKRFVEELGDPRPQVTTRQH
jgi:hypothetical protein